MRREVILTKFTREDHERLANDETATMEEAAE